MNLELSEFFIDSRDECPFVVDLTFGFGLVGLGLL